MGPPPEMRERMLQRLQQLEREGTPPNEMRERMMDFLRSTQSRPAMPERREHAEWGPPSEDEVRHAMQVLMRHRFHKAMEMHRNRPLGANPFMQGRSMYGMSPHHPFMHKPFGPPWAKHYASFDRHDRHPKHGYQSEDEENKPKKHGKKGKNKKSKKHRDGKHHKRDR